MRWTAKGELLMRPPGEIRQALGAAAQGLANERGGATWRDLAELAGVGYQAARRTVENMHRSGELQSVGSEKRPHSRKWMTLYAPAASACPAPCAALASVMRAWQA